MTRKLTLFSLVTLFSILCAVPCFSGETDNQTVAAAAPTEEFVAEKLLWSSSPERPEWTIAEPDGFNFVGVSYPEQGEHAAKEGALRSAIGSIVSYVQFIVKLQIKNAQLTQVMSEADIDSFTLNQQIYIPLAIDLVSKVHAEKWYQEIWQGAEGRYDLAFVLVSVKESAINESIGRGFRWLYEDTVLNSGFATGTSSEATKARMHDFLRNIAVNGLFSSGTSK